MSSSPTRCSAAPGCRSARTAGSGREKAARGRLFVCAKAAYFEAAFIAAEAAMFAELAASVAAEAAVIAEPIAEDAAESVVEGVVTMVVEVDGVVVVVAGGVVVVVVVSSFLLHAAKETAAARVTINSAVFIFLLDFEVRTRSPVNREPFARRAPAARRHGKAEHFQCLADDYRDLRGFP
jgi:hypothetical protein